MSYNIGFCVLISANCSKIALCRMVVDFSR